MKAAVLHKFGAVPRYEDFPDPVAGDGEVVVEVKAAAVENVDKAIAAGSPITRWRLVACSTGLRCADQRVLAGPRLAGRRKAGVSSSASSRTGHPGIVGHACHVRGGVAVLVVSGVRDDHRSRDFGMLRADGDPRCVQRSDHVA